MDIVKLTKFEVAKIQLVKAIELFCSQEPLPAITLAGAAEEILGKLVKKGGGTNALEEEIKDQCELYQTDGYKRQVLPYHSLCYKALCMTHRPQVAFD